MINTRLWNDTWVSELDPIEKLLFVYFLTNEHANISGIYELPLKIAALETGIDPSMFDKIFPRLKPKIFYLKGWVIIPNFTRHQAKNNEKVEIGIRNELTLIPSHILEQAIGYGYPMQVVSHLNLNLNLNSNLITTENFSEKILVKKDLKKEPKNVSKNSLPIVIIPNSEFVPDPKHHPPDFFLESELKKMEQTENSPFDLIATFIREKPVKVENRKQLTAVIGRNLKSAHALSGAYSNKQVFQAIDKIKRDKMGIDWTLDTVIKFLTK